MSNYKNDLSNEHLPLYPEGARLVVENENFWLSRGGYGELRVFIIGDDLDHKVQVQDVFVGLHLFVDRSGQNRRIVCQLEDLKVADKFLQVMQLIAIEAISIHGKELFQFVLSRLHEWSAFLRPRRIGISEEALIGIVGELHVFTQYFLPRFSRAIAVDSFIGPNAAPQDFAGKGYALEVKSSIKKVPSSLRISSLSQLERAQQRLGLCLIQLDNSENGFSLQSLLNEAELYLASDFPALMKFREKVNLLISDASEPQLGQMFSLNRERLWRVDDGFPAMTTLSVPTGVVRAEYSISIESIEAFLDVRGIQEFLDE